ncbi:GDSL-type esterase/lipase family protein [Capilliphycus salinus ALCB114379]|uniref:GDSL-type esterase/lipase family protein n=1 Tax=Capilliphycus salinus TaxID=2768948 RepID=UPI0039A47BC7
MRICFVGDSFVNGVGDPSCLGWTGRICVDAYQYKDEITYYNLGIRRETSADILKRWLAEVSCRLSPEYDSRLVFSFGVNDTTIERGKTRVSLLDSLNNTRQILTVALSRFPVLMIGPPPIADVEQNQRIGELSQQMRLICERVNIPYLDVFIPLKSSWVWMSEVENYDGAHPRLAGYAEWANLVKSWWAWQAWLK